MVTAEPFYLGWLEINKEWTQSQLGQGFRLGYEGIEFTFVRDAFTVIVEIRSLTFFKKSTNPRPARYLLKSGPETMGKSDAATIPYGPKSAGDERHRPLAPSSFNSFLSSADGASRY
jgi:hypothetical protein